MKTLGRTVVALAALGALAVSQTAAAQTEVKIDGFEDGDSAGFQAGFVATEIGAIRLTPSEPGARLDKVKLLFGGATSTHAVTVHVWDDPDGNTEPGTSRFSGDFELTGSNEAFTEIDLSSENLRPTGPFRIGIQFQHDGVPSIARDDDGSIDGDNNFIRIEEGTWFKSQTLGLTGDWVIRAVMSGGGGDSSPDGGPGAPDGGPVDPPASDCASNADCQAGSYCDDDSQTCTFDCRSDSDCGSAMACSSLGMCVTADGEPEGGCGCQTQDSTSRLAGLGLGIFVLLLEIGRRRHGAA